MYSNHPELIGVEKDYKISFFVCMEPKGQITKKSKQSDP